ncbi:MAG: hypothetical protein KA603_09990 [Azonexus sp.]|jgi:hypothetical protein|nr:hypothetical protein [Betaproteobacteria bacterium]MBK8916728.1 hypothetical protein [Betaproteobacteria bacterium]MBP6036451.1 hypothetical protein [Azonexus sp.]MBP6907060.1 hypothetical protein [Azonexus sp.]
MSFPEFFSRVPEVTLFDPLAALLGASSDGHIRYRYEDAVRLAGHSCPTVAGTYVLASRMLRRLYPDGPAQRGSLRVEFRRGEAEGTVGVQAAVFGLLTGAAGPGGFKGLGGMHGRCGRLGFAVADVPGDVRLNRDDTGACCTASLDLSPVPGDPALARLLGGILAGEAGAELRTEFAARWQARVERLLLEYFDHPDVVRFSD